MEEEESAEAEVVDEVLKEEVELEAEEKDEVVGDGEDEVDALDSGINRVIDPSLGCWIKEGLGLDFHREAYPKVAQHFFATLQGRPDQMRLLGNNSLVLSTLATLPIPALITLAAMPLRFYRRQNQEL